MRSERRSNTWLWIVLILAIAVGVVWWRGWFDVRGSADSGEGEREVGVSVQVDTDKIKRDTKELRQEATQWKEGADTVANLQNVEGTVGEIDMASRRFVLLREEAQNLDVIVDDESQLLADGQRTNLETFQEGDKVAVIFDNGVEPQDGAHRAMKVVLLDKSAG